MEATIKTLTDKLKTNEKAVVDNRRNVGNYEDAILEFQRALEINPSIAVIHLYLGQVYAALGRNDEAERAFRRALRRYAAKASDSRAQARPRLSGCRLRRDLPELYRLQ